MKDTIFNTVIKTLRGFCDDADIVIGPETKIVEDLSLESVDFVDFIFELEEALNTKLNIIEMNIALSKGGTRRFRELTVSNICAYLESVVK